MQTQPLTDLLGREIQLDDTVIRSSGDNDIYMSRVTRVEDGKCYLDNSKVAIRYPRRLCVITPLVSKF